MSEFRVGVKSLILHNKKVLLVQRSEISGTGGIDEWEYPGGIMNFGEDLHTALHREIKEETNLDVVIEKLLFAITVKVSPQRQIVGLTYLSYAKHDEVKLSDEHKDYCWVNKKQLSELLSSTLLEYLNENSVLELLDID